MSIQSLGVGSGLALDSLVNQLIAAERAPKQARLDRRQESLDTEISAIGTLKSKLNEFLDSVESINDQLSDTGRKPTISNPNELIEPFTAEAASGANQGAYAIAVTQLASGSRIETDDADSGGFSSSTDSVLSSGSGTLTFKIDSSGDTFTINVSAGDTLDDLRDAINDASDNFGVSANLIDTGTPEGGVKLVITSDTTGAGNDLVIVNDNNLAELQKVSTTDSTETDTYLTPVESAKNAKATIDGIAVESATNTFENTIADVSLTVKELSSKDASDNFETSTLTIGNDTEGLEESIRAFVENYNKLNDEIRSLTRYGSSELERDGALAGDAQVRTLQSGLASILSGSVGSSALGTLFELGVTLTDNGNLEIGAIDEFGSGSGQERLTEALEDNFDEIASLFTDSSEGIGTRMIEFLQQYTQSDGLLADRESAVKDQQDQLEDERAQFELRMVNYEQILRDRYLNLDQTVARLNQTGNALLASLGTF